MKSANANAARTRPNPPHSSPHSPPQQAHHATTTTSLCSFAHSPPPSSLYLSLGRHRRCLCLPPVLLLLALVLLPASLRTPHPFLSRAPYTKRTRAERNRHEIRRSWARQNTPRARQKPWAWVTRKYAKEKRTGRGDSRGGFLSLCGGNSSSMNRINLSLHRLDMQNQHYRFDTSDAGPVFVKVSEQSPLPPSRLPPPPFLPLPQMIHCFGPQASFIPPSPRPSIPSPPSDHPLLWPTGFIQE